MDKVTFIEVENWDGTITKHAIIDRGNKEYTSMPKAIYDAQLEQVEHLTEIVPGDE